MTKAEAGRKGGCATFKKYGSAYMQSIGKRGAATTHKLYVLLPVNIGGYAMTRREDQKIIAFIGGR